jgi:ABC-type nitrate/sulfonate/bicarbonate transport system permease component
MNKKEKSGAVYPVMTLVLGVVLWETAVRAFQVPGYILPAPSKIAKAFFLDIRLITRHVKATLFAAGLGIFFSVIFALIAAVIMDRFEPVKKALYPLLIISQTIPIMAVAPLMLIWFGFGYLPKILIIILMCFFPIAVSLIDGFSQVDRDYMDLFRAIKANRIQIYRDLKFPNALPYFFAGLKISVTYTLMAAIIAEWLGGNEGIGVYMLRAKQAFALDKVFAAVAFIVLLSIILIGIVNWIDRKAVHWKPRR